LPDLVVNLVGAEGGPGHALLEGIRTQAWVDVDGGGGLDDVAHRVAAAVSEAAKGRGGARKPPLGQLWMTDLPVL
jgi:hypothetical protein